MHCPHCSTGLRLVESVPSSLLDRMVVVACPAKSCGKEIVATVRSNAGFELELLTIAAARAVAFAHVIRAQRADFVFPRAAILGAATLTVILAVWALLDTSRGAIGLDTIVLGGLAIALCFGGTVVVDVWMGMRSWRRSLQRPLPQTYR